MTYEEKKKIANDHLENIGVPVEWDDLSDINSLHDCEDVADIHQAAEERAENDGFNISGIEDEEDNDEFEEED